MNHKTPLERGVELHEVTDRSVISEIRPGTLSEAPPPARHSYSLLYPVIRVSILTGFGGQFSAVVGVYDDIDAAIDACRNGAHAYATDLADQGKYRVLAVATTDTIFAIEEVDDVPFKRRQISQTIFKVDEPVTINAAPKIQAIFSS